MDTIHSLRLLILGDVLPSWLPYWQEAPLALILPGYRFFSFPTMYPAKLVQCIWLVVLSEHRVNFLCVSRGSKLITLSVVPTNPAGGKPKGAV